MSTIRPDQSRRVTAALLFCGVLAGPLFVLVFLVDGATRPGYDPMTMPVSLLAVGDRGWVQTLNFLVDGVLLAAFTIGLFRSLRDRNTPSIAGPIIIGIVALGVLGAGIFATDPGSGFPPGVPPPSVPSSRGELHDLASLLVFAGLPTGVVQRFFIVLGWGWIAVLALYLRRSVATGR